VAYEKNEEPTDELRLIKEYAALTGSTESAARSVLMYVCSHEDACDADQGEVLVDAVAGPNLKPQPDASDAKTNFESPPRTREPRHRDVPGKKLRREHEHARRIGEKSELHKHPIKRQPQDMGSR
jgi:hypothetical protein